jgi:hypothetical protein
MDSKMAANRARETFLSWSPALSLVAGLFWFFISFSKQVRYRHNTLRRLRNSGNMKVPLLPFLVVTRFERREAVERLERLELAVQLYSPQNCQKILGRAEAFGRVVPEHFSFDFIAQGVPRQHLVG